MRLASNAFAGTFIAVASLFVLACNGDGEKGGGDAGTSTPPRLSSPSGQDGTPVPDATEPAGSATPDASAEAVPPGGGVSMVFDLDLDSDGIQERRSVNVDEDVRIAVVVQNLPEGVNLGAIDFIVRYDQRVLEGLELDTTAPAIDDNPNLNEAFVGEGWDCSGIGIQFPTADDDPDSQVGQARLGCFSVRGTLSGRSGVLATIAFRAVGDGTTELTLSDVLLSDSGAEPVASCAPVVEATPELRCGSAELSVE